MHSPCGYFIFGIVSAYCYVSAVGHDGTHASPALLTDDPKLKINKETAYIRQVLRAIDQKVINPVQDIKELKESAVGNQNRYTEAKESKVIKRSAVDAKDPVADEKFSLTAILMTLYDKVVSTSTDIKTILSKVDEVLDNTKDKHEENPVKPRSCLELRNKGHVSSGLYSIFIPSLNKDIKVYCDQETDGGGWIVFQRRKDGSENFYRNFLDYQDGFGNLEGEFWLGLDYIHYLTNPTQNTLRIDLQDFELNKRYAKYSTFSVGSERSGYILTVGGYSGNAGDSFGGHNGNRFSTKDVDRDTDSSGSCALGYKGGWWYSACHHANLNGLYLRGPHGSYANGIEWFHWKGHHYSLKFTEMKIRENID